MTTFPDKTEVAHQGDGIVVVTYPSRLSDAESQRIRSQLSSSFPERRWLVLDAGATVQDTGAATRIEQKLDSALQVLHTLTQALAEEPEELQDEGVQSLDGGPVTHERDTSQPL